MAEESARELSGIWHQPGPERDRLRGIGHELFQRQYEQSIRHRAEQSAPRLLSRPGVVGAVSSTFARVSHGGF